VLVLVLTAVVLLWQVSDPADQGPAVEPPTGSAALPQAARAPSDLAEDETWLSGVVLDASTVVTTESVLRDVRAVGSDVRTGPGSLTAGILAVDATVPFDAVAQELGGRTTVRPAGPSEATVVRRVRRFGRDFRVVATGSVQVEDGRLVVEPTSIDVGGPDALADALADVVRRLVTIEHSIEGLPERLVLQDVVVQRDGFRATLRGEGVRLVQ
jgi:hypothetical protein